MVRQRFHLFGHAFPGDRLRGLDDAGMQRASPFLEQRFVGHLLGEGVPEGILPLGEQARLIEKLGPLKLCQTAVQHLRGAVGNSLERGQGHLMAHDRRRLEEVFGLWGQAVDACRQHGLDGGRHLNARKIPGQTVGPWRADQPLGLHQRPHRLLQKERVPGCPFDQERRERRQARVIPQQRLQEGVGAGRGQWIEAELCVVSLAAPAVMVFRAVVDQEYEGGRRQALDTCSRSSSVSTRPVTLARTVRVSS
jgi:hypothetical protein